MKKCLLFFIFAAAAASCVKYTPPAPDPITTGRLSTTEKFSVPIKEGYTTFVTLRGDTLCVTTEATSIWIPKGASVSTKAEESAIQVSYIEGTDPKAGTSQIWQTIGFEDTEKGDYDYNDIVFHCKYVVSGTKFGFGVHPIALGSVKTIGLGVRIFLKDVFLSEEILSNDVRKDLFDNQQGFINTEAVANFHTNFFRIKRRITIPAKTSLADIKLVWFIKVEGNKRFYSVNDHYGYLNENKRPYGLIITDTGRSYYQEQGKQYVGSNWFPYPYERVNIADAFPQFNDWIEGRIEYCSMYEPVAGKAIDPGEYKYDRPKEGPTRVYYTPTNANVW